MREGTFCLVRKGDFDPIQIAERILDVERSKLGARRCFSHLHTLPSLSPNSCRKQSRHNDFCVLSGYYSPP